MSASASAGSDGAAIASSSELRPAAAAVGAPAECRRSRAQAHRDRKSRRQYLTGFRVGSAAQARDGDAAAGEQREERTEVEENAKKHEGTLAQRLGQLQPLQQKEMQESGLEMQPDWATLAASMVGAWALVQYLARPSFLVVRLVWFIELASRVAHTMGSSDADDGDDEDDGDDDASDYVPASERCSRSDVQLWLRSPGDVSRAEYKVVYQWLMGDNSDFLGVHQFSLRIAKGLHMYAILWAPQPIATQPRRLRVYANGQFQMWSPPGMLPAWLDFVIGIVDLQEAPLMSTEVDDEDDEEEEEEEDIPFVVSSYLVQECMSLFANMGPASYEQLLGMYTDKLAMGVEEALREEESDEEDHPRKERVGAWETVD